MPESAADASWEGSIKMLTVLKQKTEKVMICNSGKPPVIKWNKIWRKIMSSVDESVKLVKSIITPLLLQLFGVAYSYWEKCIIGEVTAVF